MVYDKDAFMIVDGDWTARIVRTMPLFQAEAHCPISHNLTNQWYSFPCFWSQSVGRRLIPRLCPQSRFHDDCKIFHWQAWSCPTTWGCREKIKRRTIVICLQDQQRDLFPISKENKRNRAEEMNKNSCDAFYKCCECWSPLEDAKKDIWMFLNSERCEDVSCHSSSMWESSRGYPWPI